MRKLWQVGAVLVSLWAAGVVCGQRAPVLEHLRCDGQEAPLAIAEPHPLLTWTYATGAGVGAVETAAHVTLEDSLERKPRPVWDSGWITTSDPGLRYAGPALKPGAAYLWHVETRNRDGSVVRGESARFRMADSAWKAKWIAAPWSTERDGSEADGSKPLPVFRREFALSAKPVEATLRIAGLGQWQASLGRAGRMQLVMPKGLHGAWTDYEKTVAYDTVDVTAMLGAGKNVLSVLVGNGMYNVQHSPFADAPKKERYIKFAGSFGAPKMIAELNVRYADGHSETIASDAHWRVARGPVVFDSTYGGEDYDARREKSEQYMPGFDDSRWSAAQAVEGPGGKLIPAIAPAVTQHEMYKVAKQMELGNGRTVFDLGQNFAGVVNVRVQGPAGAIIRLTPGELLNNDGSVSQATFHGPMWWSYTLRGDAGGESWEPLFGYSGFRYVQVEWTPGQGMAATKEAASPPGRLVSLTGIAEYSDSPETGSFESSSEMLNRIHALIAHAMHSNEVSLFTDCPHREKLGWLEQTHLVAAGLMFNNDVEGLYRATDKNMADAQLPDGIVPTIAPQYTKFGPKYPIYDDSPEWGSASVLAPWWAYSFYGDKAELERSWPTMKAYITALEAKATDGIVAYGLGDWYDIGPGGPGFEKDTSLGVTGTLMLLQDAQAMQKIAALLGHTEDAFRYGELAQRTVAAFNRKFWNEQHGWYDTGSQTAQAMPLALGVVPEDRRTRVLAHLLEDIKAHHDHATAGEVGYPYLLRALGAAGHDDVVLAMLLRKDAPSYGSQLEAGATSLTEAWDANPHASQNHFMLGGAEEWLYRRLGGIDIDMSRKDAERITVRPAALAGVDWVKVGFDAKVGHVQSDWTRVGNNVDYKITVPGGIEAMIVLPETAVAADRELRAVEHESTQTTFHVGPGVWEFHAHE